MTRRAMMTAVVATLVSAGVLAGVVPAGAATTTSLLVPASSAFAVLGHSCGGIQEQAFATGFDATSGYPTGDVYLQTRCGGSGRGGGYHSTTYSAWVSATWDFTGSMISSVTLSTAPTDVSPTFSAFDANGNETYEVLSAINVLPTNCTVGNTSYCTYRAYLTLASTFIASPRVTSISLSSGPGAGGTIVTIAGTAFTGAIAVNFGGTAATSFTVNSDTSLTAVSPAASAGTVDVTVTNAGGTSATSAADQFTFVAPPSVSGLSPDTGPAAGGTSVTITGANFAGTTGVSFGGTAAAFAVNDDTSITAVSPIAEAADSVDVTVTTPGGTSAVGSADRFTFTAGCSGDCVAVGDAAMLEGDSGTRNMSFAVTLSHPAVTTVVVPYTVTAGTATAGSTPGSGADFKPKTGTLTFTPSATTGLTPTMKSVAVAVFGDADVEPDETFSVVLSNPSAGFILGRSLGTGTILNDDGLASGVTAGIGDAGIVKSDAGKTLLGVPVTLSAPATGTVTADYVITPDTATYSSAAGGGGDFGGKTSGAVTFAAGASLKLINVPIWSDPTVDTDEAFTITLTGLSNPGVAILRSEGTGTIIGR